MKLSTCYYTAVLLSCVKALEGFLMAEVDLNMAVQLSSEVMTYLIFLCLVLISFPKTNNGSFDTSVSRRPIYKCVLA